MSNTKSPIAVALLRIEELATVLHTPELADPKSFSLTDYQVKLGSRVRLNEQEKSISIFFTVDIKNKADYETSPISSPSDKMPSLHFECIMTYGLNLDLKLNVEAGTFNAPVTLVNKLGDMSYATCRGIIFSKCSATPLRGFALPLLTDEQIEDLMRPTGHKTA